MKRHKSCCYFKLLFALCLLITHYLMSTIRIGTLNLNGARDIKKRAVLFELIRQKSLDVMMVQETHSDSLNEIDWKKEWDGEVVFAHMNSVRGGVAVLFAKNFLPISYELKHVIPGRLMLVRAKFERFNFVFLNIYAPTIGAERVYFFNNVNSILQDYISDDYLFFGGDFNCTENYLLDRNHVEPHAASARVICELVETHGLCDIWRGVNNDVRQYTWAHARGNVILYPWLELIGFIVISIILILLKNV